MVLDFYYTLPSTPCRGPMMVAKALGIELNLKKVNFDNKEHLKADFIAMNPEHVVPTLVDGDFVLWESKAIIGYLVAQYGKNDALYPSEPKKRALVDRFLYFDTNLHQRFRDWAHPMMKEGKAPPADALTKLQETLAQLDKQLQQQDGSYVTGDTLSVADYTLVNSVQTFRTMGVSMSDHPNIETWLKRCAENMAGFKEICLEGSNQLALYMKPFLEKQK